MPVTEAAEWLVRPGHGFGAFPTNDGLTHAPRRLAPRRVLATSRETSRATTTRAIEQAFGDRLAAPHREERIVGGGVANRFRVPYGPGWALVGDAGYLRDPVTAHGITDAFLDAEPCAAALDDAVHGPAASPMRMADYHGTETHRVDRQLRVHRPARHARAAAS